MTRSFSKYRPILHTHTHTEPSWDHDPQCSLFSVRLLPGWPGETRTPGTDTEHRPEQYSSTVSRRSGHYKMNHAVFQSCSPKIHIICHSVFSCLLTSVWVTEHIKTSSASARNPASRDPRASFHFWGPAPQKWNHEKSQSLCQKNSLTHSCGEHKQEKHSEVARLRQACK